MNPVSKASYDPIKIKKANRIYRWDSTISIYNNIYTLIYNIYILTIVYIEIYV